MQTVNIYTDGACKNNQTNENKGGWGCILEYEGREKELSGGEKNTTNNRMELRALIEGLSALKKKDLNLNIYSDSSYLINCLKNRWYLNWQKNGWKTASKTSVENQDLWKKLIGLLEGQGTNFFLVKGHLPQNAEEEALLEGYKRFKMHNEAVDFEEFKKISSYNFRCDKLACDAAASIS